MNQKSSSINAGGIYEPFPVDDVRWEEYSHGDRFGMCFRELGAFGGSAHVGVCMEELAPGKQTNPAHYHMLEEEHTFILEGKLALRLAEKSFELFAGNDACFPSGQKSGHNLINEYDAACRYLIIGERNPNDVIVYTDSGRVSVGLTAAG